MFHFGNPPFFFDLFRSSLFASPHHLTAFAGIKGPLLNAPALRLVRLPLSPFDSCEACERATSSKQDTPNGTSMKKKGG